MSMPRCLTTRELNALRIALDKRDVSVEDVATLDYARLARVQGLGRKSILNIRIWLAEQGRTLRNDDGPDMSTVGADSLASQQLIERAIATLHEHGYTVLPPLTEYVSRER